MGRRSSCVPPAQDPGGCSRQDVLPLAQMLPSVSGKGMEGLGGPRVRTGEGRGCSQQEHGPPGGGFEAVGAWGFLAC